MCVFFFFDLKGYGANNAGRENDGHVYVCNIHTRDKIYEETSLRGRGKQKEKQKKRGELSP